MKRYEDGTPIDIPAGRWVDLRVEVYSKDISPVEIPDAADEANGKPEGVEDLPRNG